MKILGNLKYTKSLVEICPGLLGLVDLLLKRKLGSPLTCFSSERPHVQPHSVPLHPVGPLVQSCHGEKNVTYKDLETTSAAFLVFLENLLFKYQVTPALP